MVVIDDFRKQILYQRLNLGYDCTFCRKKFYSKREQLQHLQETHLNPLKKKEHIECPKCGKVFGHIQIYQLHLQIHTLSESDSSNSSSNSNNGNDHIAESDISNRKQTIPIQSQSSRPKEKQRPAATTQKKTTGLTKIKMEDCLRCDACSCIYIDQNDYYKHMRNFHKVNNVDNTVSVPIKSTLVTKIASCTATSNKPTVTTAMTINAGTATTTTPSPQKKCRSCCKQCRGNHYTGEPHNHRNHYHQHRHSHSSRIIQRAIGNELFKFSMQDNIKDRWSKMVSHRLLGSEEQQQLRLIQEQQQLQIKPDPDASETDSSIQNSFVDSDEMTHLLSQVEVKIKTEPPDEQYNNDLL